MKGPLHNFSRDMRRIVIRVCKPMQKELEEQIEFERQFQSLITQKIEECAGAPIVGVSLDTVEQQYRRERDFKGLHRVTDFRHLLQDIAEVHRDDGVTAKGLETSLCGIIHQHLRFQFIVAYGGSFEGRESMLRRDYIAPGLSALRKFYMRFQDVKDEISLEEFHKESWSLVAKTLQAFFPKVFDSTSAEGLRKKYERFSKSSTPFNPSLMIDNHIKQ